MLESQRVPGVRIRRILDVALTLWVAVWIALAIVIALEVRGLEDLSDTTVKAGRAIETAGTALETIGDIPLIGGNVRQLGEQARTAGESAVASGRSSRGSIRDLSILLAVAVALVPSMPVVLLYVPLRVSWSRQVGVVRRALVRRPGDPALTEFLAYRAVQNLPYDTLYAATPSPWRDLEEGRFDALADAELVRLGLLGPEDAVVRSRG